MDEHTASKAPVTLLGLGDMGTALARAWLAAGHPLTVWNRTRARDDRHVRGCHPRLRPGAPREVPRPGRFRRPARGLARRHGRHDP
ncbi:NAD(P)-binding domain-containing protein [Streptomyces sp. NPDC006294]|uniref:NAD(P)-binding domain-containing protein n=1 Tax=Streptomyces sp. NPDC006294 TaxID=3364743 RepID=UPI0036ABAA1E